VGAWGALFFVGGRIIAMLVAAFGFAWDVTGKSALNLAPGSWGIVAAVAFAAFVVLTTMREVQLALQQKPSIRVSPKVYYGDKAKLEIHNCGAAAVFSATARVVRGNLEPSVFNLCWESHPSDVGSLINRDDTQAILIAEISPDSEQNDNPRTAVFKNCITLYEVGGKRKGVSDYRVVEEAKLRGRYPSMFHQAPQLVDECEIEITVTAKPELSKPFTRRRHLIRIDHDHGGTLVFVALPSASK